MTGARAGETLFSYCMQEADAAAAASRRQLEPRLGDSSPIKGFSFPEGHIRFIDIVRPSVPPSALVWLSSFPWLGLQPLCVYVIFYYSYSMYVLIGTIQSTHADYIVCTYTQRYVCTLARLQSNNRWCVNVRSHVTSVVLRM